MSFQDLLNKPQTPPTLWMLGEPMLERSSKLPQHESVSGTVANASVAASEFLKLTETMYGSNARHVNLEIACALGTRGDSYGRARKIRSFLQDRGVGTHYLVDDPTRTTAYYDMHPEGSNRFEFFDREQSGATGYYETRDHCSKLPFKKGDFVVIDLISISRCKTPEARRNMLDTVKRAKKAGAIIVMDVNFRPNLWWKTPDNIEEAKQLASAAFREFLPSADIVCPSTPEDTQLLGCDDNDAFATLTQMGGKFSYMILKKGAEGSEVIARNSPRSFIIPRLDHPNPDFLARPEDSTGLGDSFLGTFCASLAARGVTRLDPTNDIGRREVVLAAACGSLMAAANIRSTGGAIAHEAVPRDEDFKQAAQDILQQNGLSTVLGIGKKL